MSRSFFEFFAGSGMARLGLGPQWRCTLANDNDPAKCRAYAANFGREELICNDVARLTTARLPGRPDLAWVSFPCQDISEAGAGAALKGWRSNALWPCLKLIETPRAEGRAPKMLVLENVTGLFNKRSAAFFDAICDRLTAMGYLYGVLQIDASLFVAQSRPRVFIIAVDAALPIPAELVASTPSMPFHPPPLIKALQRQQALPLWWRLPVPPARETVLADLLEDEPSGPFPQTGFWDTPAETANTISMMSPVNLAKLEAAKRTGEKTIGAFYRRSRGKRSAGSHRSAQEIRFDGAAGCLRMASGGGSSVQYVMIVDGGTVRSRRFSAREAARLMGLPDTYKLPANYIEAYDLAGDLLVVPVVRHLAEHVLEPILRAADLSLAAE
jgi:DNA (cytosine-5)-methyltransferase 1